MVIPSSVVDSLRAASSIAVLTGAGISAESGIPTFRGPGGYWKNHRPEELATPEAFQNDPVLIWEWYRHRRQIVDGVLPNAAHHALARLEAAFDQFSLITQNVDGLHQAAGSQQVIELHGTIMKSHCSRCGRSFDRTEESPEHVPHCNCRGALRPSVVWFGESLPSKAIDAAWNAAQSCHGMLVIGTSAVVQPAASLPLIARENGATVVEINGEETPLTPHVSHSFIGKAGELLPGIVDRVWSL